MRLLPLWTSWRCSTDVPSKVNLATSLEDENNSTQRDRNVFLLFLLYLTGFLFSG
jgi:hypothetical protein